MRGHVLVWAAGDDAGSRPYAEGDLLELRRGAARDRVRADWVVDLGPAVVESWRDGARVTCKRRDLNMGDPELLDEWIQACPALTEGEGVLIISGHGSGWAGTASTPRRRVLGDRERIGGGPHGMVAIDWGEGGDALDTTELSALLEARFRSSPLAMLGFDACFMACLELLAHLGRYARVLVASAYESPSSGWGYDAVLASYAQSPDPESFAAAIVADLGARWPSPPQGKVAHLVAVRGVDVVVALDALHALGEAAVAEGVRLRPADVDALLPFGSDSPSYDVLDVAAQIAARAEGGGRTRAAVDRLVAAIHACTFASVSHPRRHPSGLAVYVGSPGARRVAPQYQELLGPDSGWVRFITTIWTP